MGICASNDALMAQGDTIDSKNRCESRPAQPTSIKDVRT